MHDQTFFKQHFYMLYTLFVDLVYQWTESLFFLNIFQSFCGLPFLFFYVLCMYEVESMLVCNF